MNPVIRFLTALGQALAGQSLYAPSHPARRAARDRVLEALHATIRDGRPLRLSFLDGEVIVGRRALAELRGWEWATRLPAVGIARLEVDAQPLPTAEDLELLLEALRVRLTATDDASFSAFAVRGIRAGPLSVVGAEQEAIAGDVSAPALLDALAHDALVEESEALQWVVQEVREQRALPFAEVDAIVHGLVASMHRDRHLMMPLMALAEVDDRAAAHACNVAVLAMAMAEQLGAGAGDTRALGTAALLHDIGKVRVAAADDRGADGGATDASRRLHPVEGARILGAHGGASVLAATVAYEHHVWADGTGGFPTFAYPRTPHVASRIVAVANAYDRARAVAGGTPAMATARSLQQLAERAGAELDASLVEVLTHLLVSAGDDRATTPDAAPA